MVLEGKIEQFNTYADVRLLLGDQRQGKTCSMVAFGKDDYYNQLTGIQSPGGELIKARCLNKEEKIYLKKRGIFPNIFKYVRVFSDDGTKSKIIRIPKDYLVISPVKIFSNIHLYGLRYQFIMLTDIIQYLNSDLFTDAWMFSDESAMTDARNSMDAAGKIMAKLGATIGKRNLRFCQTVQYNEMVERRFRLFATMRVLCSFDKNTKRITCEIKERNKPERSVSYWAPNYWNNFRSNELEIITDKKLARALQTVG